MNLTEILAIVGAITGTIGTIAGLGALGWDYYKWRNSKRPQLRVFANGNMVTTNDRTKQKYIMVNVVNAGEKPVKLKLITYRFFKIKPKNFRKAIPDETGLFNLFNSNMVTAQLPYKIEVGDEWTGFITQTSEIEKMSKEGFLYIVAEDAITENSTQTARTLLEYTSLKPKETK